MRSALHIDRKATEPLDFKITVVSCPVSIIGDCEMFFKRSGASLLVAVREGSSGEDVADHVLYAIRHEAALSAGDDQALPKEARPAEVSCAILTPGGATMADDETQSPNADLDEDLRAQLHQLADDFTTKMISEADTHAETLQRQLFTANAGGAVAVLAYMSSQTQPTLAVLLCLGSLVVGVIAGTLASRFYMSHSLAIANETLARRQQFIRDEIESEDLIIDASVGLKHRNAATVAGWIAQLAFPTAIILGAVALI